MTEATHREMAKELAGAWYEMRRTDRFRDGGDKVKARKIVKDILTGLPREIIVGIPFSQAYPTAEAYVEAHWPFFMDTARKVLTTMLTLPNISPVMKERIYDAICEDREKQLKIEAGIIPGTVRRLIQRNLSDAE